MKLVIMKPQLEPNALKHITDKLIEGQYEIINMEEDQGFYVPNRRTVKLILKGSPEIVITIEQKEYKGSYENCRLI